MIKISNRFYTLLTSRLNTWCNVLFFYAVYLLYLTDIVLRDDKPDAAQSNHCVCGEVSTVSWTLRNHSGTVQVIC